MVKELKWFLALFLFLPLVQAGILPTNCTLSPDFQECQNILSDNSLTKFEKEDLYLNLLNSQSYLPSHEFVWNWNKNLSFNLAPESVVPKSDGIIKNAWLKIIAINKSVFDANKQEWLVQGKGKILTAKNHQIEIPSGVLPGECQTTYSYRILQDGLKVSANNQLVGTGSITEYSLLLPNKSALEFAADWQLTVQLQTNHYQNRQHCFFNGWNWFCWNACEFTGSSFDNYSTHLNDSLQAIVLINDFSVESALDSGYGALNFLIQSTEPLNQFKLFQNGEEFSKSQARYDIAQAFSPYGALFVERILEEKQNSNFIILDRNENYYSLATNSNEDCQVYFASDFEELKKPCNAVLLKKTKIELSTDQNSFDENQNINLQARLLTDQNIPLRSKRILFSSKGIEEAKITDSYGAASFSMPAKQSNGVLTARFASDFEFAGSTQTERVPIAGQDLTPTALQVGIVFFAYYLIFTFVKRKCGVF